MKRLLAVIMFVFSGVIAQAQIEFEPGYIIKNDDQKIECLIRNMDWRYNPKEIEYKLTNVGEVLSNSIEQVKEFGITNESKYIRAEIEIDRSTDEVEQLTTNRAPDFQTEVLYLQVLVEGKTSLFKYEEAKFFRLFYQKQDEEVKQLVYKRYNLERDQNAFNESIIARNDMYKQQILNNINCQNLSINAIKKLKYQRGTMVAYFVKENECAEQEYVNFDAKVKRDFFNLTFRAGVNYSTLAVENQINVRDVDFGGQINFRIGLESEFILPFNKNKWSIIIEPTFQSFDAQETFSNDFTTQDVVINYQSIELPIGLRYYFFVGEKAKILLNAGLIYDFSFNSTLEYIPGLVLDLKPKSNFFIGAGYKINRLSAEVRYQTNRQLFNNYLYWTTQYSTASVILGYSLFKK